QKRRLRLSLAESLRARLALPLFLQRLAVLPPQLPLVPAELLQLAARSAECTQALQAGLQPRRLQAWLPPQAALLLHVWAQPLRDESRRCSLSSPQLAPRRPTHPN